MIKIENFDIYSELDVLTLYAITRNVYASSIIGNLISNKTIIYNNNTAKYDLTDSLLEEYFKKIDLQLRKEDIRELDKLESPYKELAIKLMDLYPSGIKPNTTKYWRGNIFEVCRKLETLSQFVTLNEEDVINATKKYIESFKNDFTLMRILPYFIFKREKIQDDDEISIEYTSDLLATLENLNLSDESNLTIIGSNWTTILK